MCFLTCHNAPPNASEFGFPGQGPSALQAEVCVIGPHLHLIFKLLKVCNEVMFCLVSLCFEAVWLGFSYLSRVLRMLPNASKLRVPRYAILVFLHVLLELHRFLYVFDIFVQKLNKKLRFCADFDSKLMKHAQMRSFKPKCSLWPEWPYEDAGHEQHRLSTS